MTLETNGKTDPASGDIGSPEYETRLESREVVRVVALQIASLQELYAQMLPQFDDELRHAFRTATTKDFARFIFNKQSTPKPESTITVWEIKEGDKTGGQIMLPGGGVDFENPTTDDIKFSAADELKQETHHTTSLVYLRDDCTRNYIFTTVKESDNHQIRTIRRNHEYLAVAYIPPRQNTAKRFIKNENILTPVRVTAANVSKLLRRDIYESPKHTALLLDSLSLNPERHIEHQNVINTEETIRTRNAIESEVWIFEATCWKKLIGALAKTTTTHKSKALNKRIREVMQSPDPDSIDSATILLMSIKEIIGKIEHSYPAKRKPIKHRLPKQDYELLLNKGISKRTLHKRMILMDELKVAYHAAFFPKK